MNVIAAKAYKQYFGRNEWTGELPEEESQDFQCVDHSHISAVRTQPLSIEQDNTVFRIVGIEESFPKYVLNTPVDVWVSNSKNHAAARKLKEYIFKRREGFSLNQSIEEIFYSNLTRWKNDTKFTSSTHDLILHPSYQRILGLGPAALPFILRELQENGGHWFWALQAITGENPVPPENTGRVKKMAAAWIEWGRSRGII